jgi:hypothetical protein
MRAETPLHLSYIMADNIGYIMTHIAVFIRTRYITIHVMLAQQGSPCTASNREPLYYEREIYPLKALYYSS